MFQTEPIASARGTRTLRSRAVSREAAARGLTTRCSLPSREKRYQILSRSAVFATNRKAATSPKVSEALYVLFGRTNAQRATSDTSRIYRAYRLESTSLSARIASSTPTRQNIQNSVDRHNLVRVVSRTLRPPPLQPDDGLTCPVSHQTKLSADSASGRHVAHGADSQAPRAHRRINSCITRSR